MVMKVKQSENSVMKAMGAEKCHNQHYHQIPTSSKDKHIYFC